MRSSPASSSCRRVCQPSAAAFRLAARANGKIGPPGRLGFRPRTRTRGRPPTGALYLCRRSLHTGKLNDNAVETRRPGRYKPDELQVPVGSCQGLGRNESIVRVRAHSRGWSTRAVGRQRGMSWTPCRPFGPALDAAAATLPNGGIVGRGAPAARFERPELGRFVAGGATWPNGATV